MAGSEICSCAQPCTDISSLTGAAGDAASRLLACLRLAEPMQKGRGWGRGGGGGGSYVDLTTRMYFRSQCHS